MSRPSMAFYPDNWLNDLNLRACSLPTRAIWIDLICLMHDGEPYGHLRSKVGDLTVKYIAQRCNVTIRELGLAMAELEKYEIFSRTETGTIYSRRMVRDEDRRLRRIAGGSKSLENPAVPRPKKDILQGPPLTPNSVDPLDPGKGNGRVLESEKLRELQSASLPAPTNGLDVASWAKSIASSWGKNKDKTLGERLLIESVAAGEDPMEISRGVLDWAQYYARGGWRYCDMTLAEIAIQKTWKDPVPEQNSVKSGTVLGEYMGGK